MSDQNSRTSVKTAAFALGRALLLLIAAVAFGGHAMAQDDPIARFTKEILANPNSPAGYLNRCGLGRGHSKASFPLTIATA